MNNDFTKKLNKLHDSIEEATKTRNNINADEFFNKYGELYKKNSNLGLNRLEDIGSEFKDRFDPYSVINLQDNQGNTIMQLPPLFNSLNSINPNTLNRELLPNLNQINSTNVHPSIQNEQFEKTELSVILSQLENGESVSDYKDRKGNQYKDIVDKMKQAKIDYMQSNQTDNKENDHHSDPEDLIGLVEVVRHIEDDDIFDDIFD